MFFTFLNHQRKAFWRARNQAGNIIIRLIMGFFILYFLVMSIAAGFFMEKIIAGIFPHKNVIETFNGLIIYYFMADFIMRIQLQELPTLSIVPYLHLNISKRKLVNFLNTKSLFTAFNVIPLIVFLPFCATKIAGAYCIFPAVMYIVSIISLVAFNNYLVLYIKRRSIANILYMLAGIIIIPGLGALEYFNIISIATGANIVFHILANQPLSGFCFIIPAAIIFIINSAYLNRNLYIEELSKKAEKRASTDYPFLNRFGKAGELAALELKLILRHKRSRSTIFLGFIFLFYGFIFYKPEFINANKFASLIFAALFMTGIFIISYGQFMFAWQSAHFDGLLANKINFKNFIRAKFLLFTISSTAITLLSCFYVFLSWKLLLLQLALYFYNIGFGTVIVLFFATMNYKRLDITKRATFNWQGSGGIQFIMTFPLLLIPFAIYAPFGITDKPYWGLIAIGIFGLISLLMRNFWVDQLTKRFVKQRYKIAEGFRE